MSHPQNHPYQASDSGSSQDRNEQSRAIGLFNQRNELEEAKNMNPISKSGGRPEQPEVCDQLLPQASADTSSTHYLGTNTHTTPPWIPRHPTHSPPENLQESLSTSRLLTPNPAVKHTHEGSRPPFTANFPLPPRKSVSNYFEPSNFSHQYPSEQEDFIALEHESRPTRSSRALDLEPQRPTLQNSSPDNQNSGSYSHSPSSQSWEASDHENLGRHFTEEDRCFEAAAKASPTRSESPAESLRQEKFDGVFSPAKLKLAVPERSDRSERHRQLHNVTVEAPVVIPSDDSHHNGQPASGHPIVSSRFLAKLSPRSQDHTIQSPEFDDVTSPSTLVESTPHVAGIELKSSPTYESSDPLSADSTHFDGQIIQYSQTSSSPFEAIHPSRFESNQFSLDESYSVQPSSTLRRQSAVSSSTQSRSSVPPDLNTQKSVNELLRRSEELITHDVKLGKDETNSEKFLKEDTHIHPVSSSTSSSSSRSSVLAPGSVSNIAPRGGQSAADATRNDPDLEQSFAEEVLSETLSDESVAPSDANQWTEDQSEIVQDLPPLHLHPSRSPSSQDIDYHLRKNLAAKSTTEALPIKEITTSKHYSPDLPLTPARYHPDQAHMSPSQLSSTECTLPHPSEVGVVSAPPSPTAPRPDFTTSSLSEHNQPHPSIAASVRILTSPMAFHPDFNTVPLTPYPVTFSETNQEEPTRLSQNERSTFSGNEPVIIRGLQSGDQSSMHSPVEEQILASDDSINPEHHCLDLNDQAAFQLQAHPIGEVTSDIGEDEDVTLFTVGLARDVNADPRVLLGDSFLSGAYPSEASLNLKLGDQPHKNHEASDSNYPSEFDLHSDQPTPPIGVTAPESMENDTQSPPLEEKTLQSDLSTSNPSEEVPLELKKIITHAEIQNHSETQFTSDAQEVGDAQVESPTLSEQFLIPANATPSQSEQFVLTESLTADKIMTDLPEPAGEKNDSENLSDETFAESSVADTSEQTVPNQDNVVVGSTLGDVEANVYRITPNKLESSDLIQDSNATLLESTTDSPVPVQLLQIRTDLSGHQAEEDTKVVEIPSAESTGALAKLMAPTQNPELITEPADATKSSESDSHSDPSMMETFATTLEQSEQAESLSSPVGDQIGHPKLSGPDAFEKTQLVADAVDSSHDEILNDCQPQSASDLQSAEDAPFLPSDTPEQPSFPGNVALLQSEESIIQESLIIGKRIEKDPEIPYKQLGESQTLEEPNSPIEQVSELDTGPPKADNSSHSNDLFSDHKDAIAFTSDQCHVALPTDESAPDENKENIVTLDLAVAEKLLVSPEESSKLKADLNAGQPDSQIETQPPQNEDEVNTEDAQRSTLLTFDPHEGQFDPQIQAEAPKNEQEAISKDVSSPSESDHHAGQPHSPSETDLPRNRDEEITEDAEEFSPLKASFNANPSKTQTETEQFETEHKANIADLAESSSHQLSTDLQQQSRMPTESPSQPQFGGEPDARLSEAAAEKGLGIPSAKLPESTPQDSTPISAEIGADRSNPFTELSDTLGETQAKLELDPITATIPNQANPEGQVENDLMISNATSEPIPPMVSNPTEESAIETISSVTADKTVPDAPKSTESPDDNLVVTEANEDLTVADSTGTVTQMTADSFEPAIQNEPPNAPEINPKQSLVIQPSSQDAQPQDDAVGSLMQTAEANVAEPTSHQLESVPPVQDFSAAESITEVHSTHSGVDVNANDLPESEVTITNSASAVSLPDAENHERRTSQIGVTTLEDQEVNQSTRPTIEEKN